MCCCANQVCLKPQYCRLTRHVPLVPKPKAGAAWFWSNCYFAPGEPVLIAPWRGLSRIEGRVVDIEVNRFRRVSYVVRLSDGRQDTVMLEDVVGLHAQPWSYVTNDANKTEGGFYLPASHRWPFVYERRKKRKKT